MVSPGMNVRYDGLFTRAFLWANFRCCLVNDVLDEELLALAAELPEGVALRSAPPLARVRLALLLQVGHAPGPASASTRRAIAICSALVAWCACEAYVRPP